VGTVMVVSAASFLAVRALATPGEAALEREREYFSRRDRPVDFAAEIGAGNDGRQLRVVGAFGTALGLAILLLLIPASSAGHWGKIGVVALATCATGSGMLWLGLRAARGRPPAA